MPDAGLASVRVRARAAAAGIVLLALPLGLLHAVWLRVMALPRTPLRGSLELVLASVGAYVGLAILLIPVAVAFTAVFPGFVRVGLARPARALAGLVGLTIAELGGAGTLALWADTHEPASTRGAAALTLVVALVAALVARFVAVRRPPSVAVLRGAHGLAALVPVVLLLGLPASLLAHDGARLLLYAALLLPLAPQVGLRGEPRGRRVALALGLLALAWTLFAARQAPRSAAAMLPRHEPLRVFMAVVGPLGDLDGDGASALFGARDCAPFDRFVGPHAVEVAGNGVDDNCLLGDLADDASPPIPEFGPPWLAGADILIISIDALRPDHMSMFGHPYRTTPNIDRHFAGAFRFLDAYAEADSTRDTLPSLLSGRGLLDLRWQVDEAVTLDPGNRFLGDFLPNYHPAGVLPFTAVNMLGSARLGLGSPVVYEDHNGRGSTATAVTNSVLHAHFNLPRPRLLFAHYYEPHEPHVSHASFTDVSPDLYDQEIARADRSVGRLLDVLAERGDDARTIVVLTADHGEAFDEHGHSFHNVHVFEEDLRVPLLVRVPGRPGGDIRGPVSNTQLAATLLELVGAPMPAQRGPTRASLVPRMRGEPPDEALVTGSARALNTPGKWMLRRGDTKVILDIEAGSELSFDLAADPGETRPLAPPRALIDDFREHELGAARSRALRAMQIEPPASVTATPLVPGLALLGARAELVDPLTLHPRLPARLLVRLQFTLGEGRPDSFVYRVELRDGDTVIAGSDEAIAGGRASLRSWPAGASIEDVRSFKLRREHLGAEIFVHVGAQRLELGPVDAQPVAP